MRESKKIALIACSNGLGHTRRMIALALALDKKGQDVTLMAPRKDVLHLQKIYKIPKIKNVNYISPRNPIDGIKYSKNQLKKKLPCLKQYKIVISDNLLEVLRMRPDAWISGSFFWHHEDSTSRREFKICQTLLRRCKPRIICSKLFMQNYLKGKNTSQVGLFKLSKEIKQRKKRGLLISFGKNANFKKEIKNLVKKLIKQGNWPGLTIYLEPRVYSTKYPSWIKKADFTAEMFEKIKAAVIRPGIGTVTECLLAGCKMFLFSESNNEMLFNGKIITKIGAGLYFKSAESALNSALLYLKKQKLQSLSFKQNCYLSFNGAEEFANLVMEKILKD